MMGKSVSTDTVPVTKGTSGVLIFPENSASRPEHFNCIRCGRCVSVCPMGIEPYLVKNMAVVKMYEELQKERVLDCIECGSCAYTCPAGEPLLDYIRLGKANLNKILRAKKS
jgi:electron transport complex protein RnfC